MRINIALADDHILFLRSLGELISRFPGFEVVCEAVNGDELLRKIAVATQMPDIVLVDVNMPIMDGPKTARQLMAQYPQIKTVALSMKSDDLVVISMLKAGCCAYLLKDIHPDELEKALIQIFEKGFYNADVFNINFRRLVVKSAEEENFAISDREKEFLKLACTDLTYKQIAAEMFLAERTIDGYREALFGKLNVKSRVGLAMEAIRRKLVEV